MNLFKISTKVFFLILSVFFAISCVSDKPVEDDKIKNTSIVIGKWTIKAGATYAINENGKEITTATLKPNVFAHELLANGDYIGHDYVGNTTVKGSWKLENTIESSEEFKTTLAITTPDTQANKGSLFIDQDGYQRFLLSIAIKTTPNTMHLKSKEYEAYPYDKNWAVYTFFKQ